VLGEDMNFLDLSSFMADSDGSVATAMPVRMSARCRDHKNPLVLDLGQILPMAATSSESNGSLSSERARRAPRPPLSWTTKNEDD